MGCVNRINLAQDRCSLQENACKHCVQLSVLFQDDHTHLEMNYETPSSYIQVKVKGKAIPLQAWTGPEGSRRLRFPDFKTIST